MSQESIGSSFVDVEAVLGVHPKVRECAVIEIVSAAGRKTLIAYVVSTGEVEVDELRSFLADRLLSPLIPQTVVLVPSLPRGQNGEVDYAGLPLPAQRGPVAGGKGIKGPDQNGFSGCGAASATLFLAFFAFILTGVFWPHSTDLSGVPQPWTTLFFGLYICECLSFGLGVVFLFFGHDLMAPHRRPPWLTRLAHLAVVWLLTAWWPQDNFYRLAAKTDWPRQAALVYAFNISLMIAAAVAAAYLAAKPTYPRTRPRAGDR